MASLTECDFVRKQKGGSAVVESNKEHMPIQIVDFAHDGRLLAETHATIMISD